VDVVYEWARGVPFVNITSLTLVQEGSIVRTITRLDELLREVRNPRPCFMRTAQLDDLCNCVFVFRGQVRNCARVVGNPGLYRKMEAASAAIKRDVVFAQSLYIQ